MMMTTTTTTTRTTTTTKTATTKLSHQILFIILDGNICCAMSCTLRTNGVIHMQCSHRSSMVYGTQPTRIHKLVFSRSGSFEYARGYAIWILFWTMCAILFSIFRFKHNIAPFVSLSCDRFFGSFVFFCRYVPMFFSHLLTIWSNFTFKSTVGNSVVRYHWLSAADFANTLAKPAHFFSFRNLKIDTNYRRARNEHRTQHNIP